VCDLETSRIGAPYIYIYIYIYDISSLRVRALLVASSGNLQLNGVFRRWCQWILKNVGV